MADLRLHFDGPFGFIEGEDCIFESRWAYSSGIYLWAIRQQARKAHLIHYVGETAQLGKRHREHLVQILGLNYGIFDPEDAEKGICTVLWKGLWREKNLAATPKAINVYEELQGKVMRYVRSLKIFFADVPVESQARKHIEGCIGWNLRNKNQHCKQLYPDDNRVIALPDKTNGELHLTSSAEILGLDSCIAY
jgi:hypothetical protein